MYRFLHLFWEDPKLASRPKIFQTCACFTCAQSLKWGMVMKHRQHVLPGHKVPNSPIDRARAGATSSKWAFMGYLGWTSRLRSQTSTAGSPTACAPTEKVWARRKCTVGTKTGQNSPKWLQMAPKGPKIRPRDPLCTV